MQLQSRFILLPLCVFILLFTGCRKIIEEVISGGPSAEKPLEEEVKCRIHQIIFSQNEALQTWVTDTVTFEYNEWGNPVYVRHSLEKTLYSEGLDKAFKYDTEGRLIGYVNQINGNTDRAVEWHVYTYANNIVIDSNFVYPTGDWKTNDRPESGFVYVSTYQLDERGRIVKETFHWLDEFANNYVYDVSGNLINPGVGYNTQILNIKRTHPVWQFIAKDYSVNSMVKSTEVNEANYPLLLTQWEDFVGMFDTSEASGKVIYSCSNILIK